MKKLILGMTAMGALMSTGLTFAARADSRKEEPRAMMRQDIHEDNTLLLQASQAYRALTKQGQIPKAILSKTDCIAVIPKVITAAAVVGGSHGNGVVSCKLSDGKWSDPAFYDLNEASLGAQIGAKSTDLVMYLMNGPSVSALKRGTIDFGADASVVAGNFNRTFDTSQIGVVAYQASQGAFMGAALTGGKLSSDDDANEAYYGRRVEAAALLDGRAEGISSQNDPLRPLFPH